MKAKTLVLLFLFAGLCAFAQLLPKDTTKFPYDKNYFVSPVDGAVKLAGNFGELRPNHFHGGIDVSTDGQIGKRIYSCAEGYVSRISMNSAWGYGKTLYITHPNGLTTVYCHLDGFAPKVDSALKAKRTVLLENKNDIYFDPIDYPLKKKQFVAYSGTTGHSPTPHLHLEIHRGTTEINPLFFNWGVVDNIAPIIKGIRIYPLSDTSAVNKTKTPVYLHTSKINGTIQFYTEKDSVKYTDTLKVYGPFGLGYFATDKFTGRANTFGVYKSCVYLDGKLIYSHSLDEIEHTKWRYINSHTDYLFKREQKRWIEKCFLDQNYLTTIYDSVANRGRMSFNDTLVHVVKLEVFDIHGNKASVRLPVVMGPKTPYTLSKRNDTVPYILHNEEFEYIDSNFKFKLPAYSVYNDVKLKYKKGPKVGKCVSTTHTICHDATPLQNGAMICFSIDTSLYCYRDKFTIGLLDGNNVIVQYKAADLHNDTASGEIRNFGRYCLSIDTLAPYIHAQNVKNNQKIGELKELKFTIEDWQSKIARFDGYFDEKWELLEYDSKTKTISMKIPNNIVEGEHTARIVVIDNNLNKRELILTIIK